ncbi:hypothetical protein BMETH_855_1 [methanotrophic bacterial endosymbiont of Bathymodiolus sp.]|nr:hypothetical protein BMETH_855_1 [methanotrophic bacterial endosymbiont of Bathymodiolus sp.]
MSDLRLKHDHSHSCLGQACACNIPPSQIDPFNPVKPKQTNSVCFKSNCGFLLVDEFHSSHCSVSRTFQLNPLALQNSVLFHQRSFDFMTEHLECYFSVIICVQLNVLWFRH